MASGAPGPGALASPVQHAPRHRASRSFGGGDDIPDPTRKLSARGSGGLGGGAAGGRSASMGGRRVGESPRGGAIADIAEEEAAAAPHSPR